MYNINKITSIIKNKDRQMIVLFLCIILITTSVTTITGKSFEQYKNITSDFSSRVGSRLSNLEPIYDLTTVDEPTITFHVDIPEICYGSINTKAGTYATVDMVNEGYSTTIGEAKLPLLHKFIEIPQCANPNVVVVASSWVTTSLSELNLPKRIIPVQAPVMKIPDAHKKAEFALDQNYYVDNKFTPSEIARVVNVGEIRGHRFALVEISPVQYNPSTGKLNILTTCELQINLPGSDMIQTQYKKERYNSPAYEEIYQALFQDYRIPEKVISPSNKDPTGYLIIVYDSFYEEIAPLASWKQTIGYDVTTTKTSEIPGGPTKENIKAYIETAYNEWPVPPSFILLVGDTPQIPTFTGNVTGTAADLYYVTINPEDYLPDIFIGRFPAAQESHVDTMVGKTLQYEQCTFPSSDFLGKAAFMAGTDNYHISEGTHNHVIETYLEPNGYTCDKLYMVTYGATTQDVRDAHNDGRGLSVFSGHGSSSGWGDGPPFYQSDVNGLTNQDMYPFVCSHACSTNPFDIGECFGETWLRASNKGGLTFWGSSDSTYWDEDDILESKMFYAWWVDYIDFIGGMTDMALYYLYIHYSGGGLTEYYFECYNLLGDPSIATKPPITAEHNVGVTALDAPDYAQPREQVDVNATIVNNGQYDESDVLVRFRIDDIEVDNTTISLFENHTFEQVEFQWIPPSVGIYTITINVSIPDVIEDFYTDNEKSTDINVFLANGYVLLVDDDVGDSYETYYEDAISSNEYLYDVWNRGSQGSPSTSTMLMYDVVIWFTGDDYTTTLDTVDQSNLANYLDAGGRLFISGQDIGYDINTDSFYTNYLHATYNRDTAGWDVVGETGDVIGDGLAYMISGGDGANNQNWPDGISPISPAISCFYYSDSTPDKAMIRVDTGVYRLVYLGFGFEAIDNMIDRNEVMSRSIDWLLAAQQPPYVPSNPNPGDDAIDVSVDADMSWIGGDPNPGDTVTYNVYFDTFSPPTTLVSVDQTGTTYDPGILEYNTQYYWQIVADDGVAKATTPGPIWSFTTENKPTIVSIDPPSQTVGQGETFTVSVWVDSGQPIKGIKFETLYFNASLIQCTWDAITNPSGITFDGFFSPLNTVNSIQFGLTAVDNVAGEVQIVWEGATGNHTFNITNNASFVTIEFEAQTTLGTSNLDLDGVEITDPDVNVLPTVINNGNVTVVESDITPPEITEVTVTYSDPKDTDSDYGWENFTCTVTDNTAVDEVKLILMGDATTEYPMIKDGDNYYCNITIETADEYTYHIWANDTSDNYNTSTPQPFYMPMNADVNEDGSVGFVDIMMVAGMWNAGGPNGWDRADVDNNGEVGFVDIMMVAGMWGQEW